LGTGKPRNDKVLSDSELDDFLKGELVVEEKIDGANLGLSLSDDGQLRAQNRGSYLDLAEAHGQWKPLPRWVGVHRAGLEATLCPGLILFGEWCYAVHSVRYTRLPDWFLAFDVYDRSRGEFWSTERRDALAGSLGIASVPHRGRGHFDLAKLKALLAKSAFSDGRAEGLYLRRENSQRLLARAKLVGPEFVQAITEHWSRRKLETNGLASRRLS
jgi:hypothetical protein